MAPHETVRAVAGRAKAPLNPLTSVLRLNVLVYVPKLAILKLPVLEEPGLNGAGLSGTTVKSFAVCAKTALRVT
jgi:hypothetical protein